MEDKEEIKWNNLDAKTMMNYYLYGQKNKPTSEELVSDKWIRDKKDESDDAHISLDLSKDFHNYMTDGPGRYSNASEVPLVKRFFDTNIDNNGERKVFNIKEAVAKFGDRDNTRYLLQKPVSNSEINSNKSYKLTQDDYYDGDEYSKEDIERIFMYQTQRYTLHKDVKFIIEPNGYKHIENMALMLYDEDFDFNGGVLSNMGNGMIEYNYDPSDIGRRVDINYLSSEGRDSSSFENHEYTQYIKKYGVSYNKVDYKKDKKRYKKESHYPDSYDLYKGQQKLVDDLYKKGITQLKDSEGRLIVYGTEDDDNLSTPDDDYKGGFGIGIDSKQEQFYEDNSIGLTLIGGAGDDILTGQKKSDYLDGGKGFDTYNVSNKDEIIDKDSLGKVIFDGIDLTGVKQVDENQTRNIDDKFFYYQKSNYLKVITKDSNSFIKILNWKNKNLGIELIKKRTNLDFISLPSQNKYDYVTLPSQNKYDYKNNNKQTQILSKDIYIVKKGDYLGKIAYLYNITVDEILNLNPQILDKNKILIGQKININKKLSEDSISKEKDVLINEHQKIENLSSSTTWDSTTNERIQKIHPLIRNNAINFINSVQKKLNIKLRVTDGMRTIKEQNDLYKKGRTQQGAIVTNVRGGGSYHNYGLAIDVVEIKGNQVLYRNPQWLNIAKIGKEKGFKWGGDWKGFNDRPHFEKSFGYTTKELKRMLERGQVKNGFVDVGGGDKSTTTSLNTEPQQINSLNMNSDVYRVKERDTLSQIAQIYNLTLSEILNLNPQILDKDKIFVGQMIYLSNASLTKQQNVLKEEINSYSLISEKLDSNFLSSRIENNIPLNNIKNFNRKNIKKRNNNSNTININLENKSQKLFKKLGLRHEKIPTLKHNQNLLENVEGMYKKDDLSLKKNPRVSDKKAEAVAMHEIYHHTQKDKGLEIGSEESTANMIEKAYLNENQETSQEPDFDLIYAYTIKQFYEHEELEQLVRVLGGDAFSARMVYSNAMEVIAETKKRESNNVGYGDSQVKKVVGGSGVKYKTNIVDVKNTLLVLDDVNQLSKISEKSIKNEVSEKRNTKIRRNDVRGELAHMGINPYTYNGFLDKKGSVNKDIKKIVKKTIKTNKDEFLRKETPWFLEFFGIK